MSARTLLSRPRIWLIILVLIGLALFTYKTLQPKKTTTSYLTAEVTQGQLEDNVLASGVFQAQKLVSVGAQTSGEVKRLYVNLGDTIKKGQLIAEIDALTQQNSLKNAMAALKSQQAQKLVKQAVLKQARLEWQRQKMMLAQDATSRQAYEAAEATLQTAQAEITALDAQIEQARITANTAQLNIDHTQITAPIDGTVVAIDTEQGQTVNANQSTPTIVKLANLQTLTIKAQISEADVVKVSAGLPVYFTILGDPDTKHQARLRAVEPAPETISTNTAASSTNAIYYNGLIDVPNNDGKLRINMTAQVYIVLKSVDNALLIPAAAIKHTNKGEDEVRVLAEDGTATKRKVNIGMNNRVNAQVLSGLTRGEKVVIGEEDPEISKKSATVSSKRRGSLGF